MSFNDDLPEIYGFCPYCHHKLAQYCAGKKVDYYGSCQIYSGAYFVCDEHQTKWCIAYGGWDAAADEPAHCYKEVEPLQPAVIRSILDEIYRCEHR